MTHRNPVGFFVPESGLYRRRNTLVTRAPTLLTVPEAAEYLRLTPGALYTQRHRGEKPGILGVHVGKKLLFRPEDIENYLDEQRAAQVAS